MSIRNLCIVKFRRSDKYAIRKGFFIHMYFDSPIKVWLEKDDYYFEESCLIDSLEVARSILKELKKPTNSNFKDEEVVER